MTLDQAVLDKRVVSAPYIELCGTWGDIEVWIVDGAWVRANKDEDFTNFGQHYRFDFIPENQFWLDKGMVDNEYPFFVRHLLVEHRLMAAGMSYDKALKRADADELKGRRNAKKVVRQSGKKKPTADQLARIQLLLLGIASVDAVQVWLVDGSLVRLLLDVDYVEGGHDRVYKWMPPGHCWIDDTLQESERPYVILHELGQRILMGPPKNMKYVPAHEKISKVEYRCRHHPEDLEKELEKVGWSLDSTKIDKGGPGSGNFGHEGRPGEVGGSGEGGGGEAESTGGGVGEGGGEGERFTSSSKWVDSLSDAQYEAMDNWVSGSWDKIRAADLTGKKDKYGMYAKNMQEALNTAPLVKSPFVYRGISVSQEDAAKIAKVGGEIKLEAISSFSGSMDDAKMFAYGPLAKENSFVVFKVDGPKSAMSIKGIELQQAFDVKECLYLKGSKFQITSVKSYTDKSMGEPYIKGFIAMVKEKK